MKLKLIFFLLLFLPLCLYISARDYGNLNLVESDSWIHVSKVIKYMYDGGPFNSPIFLEDKNHYAPLTYFISNFLAIFFDTDPVLMYGIGGLVLRILWPLVLLVCTQRIFGQKNIFILCIFFLIPPRIGLEMNPNSFATLMTFVFIFLTTLPKPPTVLLIIMSLSVGFAHIFFVGFLFLFLFFFFLFKKTKFANSYIFSDTLRTKDVQINVYTLIFILLLFFIQFSAVRGFIMSEISISLSSAIGLIGIGFLPHIFQSIESRSLCTAKTLLAIYLVMLIFYFSGFWEFHSQYYSSYFTSLILVPGSIVLFYNYLRRVGSSIYLRGVFIFLMIFPLFGGVVGDISTAADKQSYRERSTVDFESYKEMFKGKVLFLDPGEFMNRFVVVDWESYIYSAPYGSYKKTGSRPFTTLPDTINAFPTLFHQRDRLDRADAFITDPNIWTFGQLNEYRIDFFIISKGKSVINSPVVNDGIHQFLSQHTVVIGETNNYIIYKK